MIFACFLLLLLGAVAQDCPADKPNMFISLHAHLDAFWLKTEEELRNINFIPDSWFYSVVNQRNSKQVFNAMYDALSAPGKQDRRYFISEVYFFRDWYEYLDSARQETVRKMLRTGQLEIVNSGWIENDQAICYYDDIIEQYTLGMNYMHNEFNFKAKLGWVTDSFGHSHSQAALVNELGLEMQVVQRVDGRYIYHRKGGPLLEWYWLTKSDSNNITYGGLMTNLRHWPHTPSGLRSQPNGIAANEIRSQIALMKRLYGKNVLFKFYGDDFEEILPSEFENLEKGMDVVNKEEGCKAAHYGNPSEFLVQIKNYFADHTVLTREYDLMPNYDEGSYWAGYYTTYPELKKLCKDSSRLLNFYKKALLHEISTSNKDVEIKDLKGLAQPAQQLVALMQHHDGITATSKHHVMLDMIGKLKRSNEKLRLSLAGLHRKELEYSCNLLQNNNQCTLSSDVKSLVELTVFNFGTARSQRIEIKLPTKRLFKAQDGVLSEIFCLDERKEDCRLIIQAVLRPPNVIIRLREVDYETSKKDIVGPQTSYNGSYKWLNYSIVDKTDTRIEFDGHYLRLGYYLSPADGQMRTAWFYNKEGTESIRSEVINSGFYLLSNTGVTENFGGNIKDFNILKGANWAKIVVNYRQNIRTTITVSASEVGIFDVITDFSPIAKNADFYLRVESDIQSLDNSMYHDANGYLVAKREFNKRPDFEFISPPQDKINANTYPVTSFAYIRNNIGKMVVSTDRAEGVAIQSNNTLLLNIDRYTSGDDRRGAAEGYTYVIPGIYRHRIAVTGSDSDIERQWQKQHDQGLLGYINSLTESQQHINPPLEPTLHSKYLKLTTAFLTENTIVVRLQNLAEFSSLTVQLMKSPTELSLPDFNLALEVANIQQSYLSGLPLTPGYKWTELPLEGIVDIHQNRFDGREVLLKPLQIRSFRVELGKRRKSHLQKQEP